MLNLTARRYARNWTQRHVAGLVGVDHSTVSFWESGKQRPRGRTAWRLERVFGEPIAVLFAQNDDRALAGADAK